MASVMSRQPSGVGNPRKAEGGKRNTESRTSPTAYWRLLRMGPESAALNMAVDDALLRGQAAHPQPILRIYEWESPAFSLGYFEETFPVSGFRFPVFSNRQLPATPSFRALAPTAASSLQFTRRPTGGGTVIHDGALTFSVIAPSETPGIPANVLDSYRVFSDIAVDAFRRINAETSRIEECSECDASLPNFCLLRPTQHDVAFKGRKVAGAAQRRTREGLLHQAYVVVRFPSRQTWDFLAFEGMESAVRRTSVSLEEGTGRTLAWGEVAEAVIEAFQEAFGVRFEETPLTENESETAETRLKAVYGRDELVFGDRLTRKRLVRLSEHT